MHSKLFVVKFNFETTDLDELNGSVQGMVDDYSYEGSEIDYFQTMEELASMGESKDFDSESKGKELRKEYIKETINRLCEEYYAYNMGNNTVKFTKRSMEKYYSSKIDEVLKFMKQFKYKKLVNGIWNKLKYTLDLNPKYKWVYNVDEFVSNFYHLNYSILNSEHPKYFSMYTYMENESDIIHSIYSKMKYDSIDEIEMTLIDVWDYHF